MCSKLDWSEFACSNPGRSVRLCVGALTGLSLCPNWCCKSVCSLKSGLCAMHCRYCSIRYGHAVAHMPLETAAAAPRAEVDPLVYMPPALRSPLSTCCVIISTSTVPVSGCILLHVCASLHLLYSGFDTTAGHQAMSIVLLLSQQINKCIVAE